VLTPSRSPCEVAKRKEPRKTQVFTGFFDFFYSRRELLVGAEGLKVLVQNAGQMALSKNDGQPGGQFATDSKLQAVVDAWPSLSVLARRKILRAVQEDVTSV